MWCSRRIALTASVIATFGCGEAREPGSSGTAGSTMTTVAGGSGRGGRATVDPSGGVAGSATPETTPSGGASGFGGASGATSAGAVDSAGGADSAAGASSDAGAAGLATALDVETILESYRSFAPLTPEPVGVSSYIFGLCRLPTLPEQEFLESVHGDGRFLQDFANASAQAGLQSRGVPPFPAGAVIVKEKYAGPSASQSDLVAIGMMIKRAPGFDAAHGDWDYAYYEPALGVVQTAEQSRYCAGCHAGASETDYVFVDGLQP